MKSKVLHLLAYLFVFILIFNISILKVYSVCNTNKIPINAGISNINLPDAKQGEWFEETIHFRFADKINGNHADSFHLSLNGLPNGLSYECDQKGCVYDFSKSFGCVTIKGTVNSKQGNYFVSTSLKSYSRLFNRVLTENIDNRLSLKVQSQERADKNENAFKLLPNHPNPFTRFTEIRFITPHHEIVELSIFDLLGNKVFSAQIRTVPGINNYTFAPGDQIQSGSYFYTIKSKEGSLTRRMHIAFE